MRFISPSFGERALKVLAAKSGIRGASFCFRWLRGSHRPLMSSNNNPEWKLLEEHVRPLRRRSHFGNKIELYQKPEPDISAVSCSREPIYYLNSAFRSSRENHVFMFIKYMYVVLKYDPASPSKDLLVRGPLRICDGFPFLYDTFFQNYGVDAAFGCHGDNDEALLFSRYGCAKIKYDPDTFLGDLIQGPMLTNEMFPFVSRIDFLVRLDAAFESTVPGEAYLFQGANYALVNYTKRSQVSTGFIKDLFPCLQNTVFVSDIGAAFASHAPNQAYLFKDSSYVIIHYTPGKPDDSYIVAGPEEIVPANWPSLRGIVPHDIILHDVIEPRTWTPIWEPKDHSWKVGPIDYWEKLDEEAGGVGNLSTNEEPTKVGLKNGGKSYKHDTCCCSKLGGCLCCFIVKEDCRTDEDNSQEQNGEEEALFCTLCNAEWLNNCVGRKNYITFICLMAASLVWLIFESAVGILVLVRCFVDRKATENDITDRLGDGFSRPPFAAVVALCTAVSFLATVPLGELFFFHIILIRKGITTYEYVVAMRTQSEPPGPSVDGGEQQSSPSSPSSSAATAVSGRSSAGKGLQYKGAWCTPPRPVPGLLEAQGKDEIIHHLEPGRLPSTVDPDAQQPDKGKKIIQRPIRISAWKLAKLDSNEAIKAGAKARASSSVLRPIGSKPHHYDADYISTTTMSGKSSPVSTRHGCHETNAKSPYPPSRASRDETDTCARSISNLSSPLAMNLSPLSFDPNSDNFNPMYQSPTARSPNPAGTNNPSGPSGPQVPDNAARFPTRKNNPGPDENVRSSVYWDPEAGRFVSAATRSVGSSSQASAAELTYTGQSIFFGGPLSNEQMNRGTRSTGSTSSYYQQGRSQRGGQLPVFVPSDPQQQNQFSSRLD